MLNWADEFDGAITICDRNGIVVYMNAVSKAQFRKSGGEELIGKNLLDCHPEPSKSMLREMLKNPAKHAYTVENDGKKKQVLQTPWMQKGEFAGVIEISFELPEDMPHRTRS